MVNNSGGVSIQVLDSKVFKPHCTNTPVLCYNVVLVNNLNYKYTVLPQGASKGERTLSLV